MNDYDENCALLDCMIPTIIPNIPNAEANISTIKILTNKELSCASENAHALPAIKLGD